MSITRDILEDILATLREVDGLADARIGSEPAVTAVPRAAVLCEGTDAIAADGLPNAHWMRLRLRVVLATRSDQPAEAIGRLSDLTDAVTTALLNDPTRGGLCQDLPSGRATAVLGTKMPRTPEFPERKTGLAPATPTHEVALLIECHYCDDGFASYPATRLDGETLFDSGPHTLTAGPWQRELQRRAFNGLDGELTLDLGRRGRSMKQAGRLSADSVEALQALIDAIEAFNDGRPHTLIDPNGREQPRVLITRFALTTPVNAGRLAWCDYTLDYQQSP